jgi:ABC-type multidrug transport system fused ATPase/permease subunit
VSRALSVADLNGFVSKLPNGINSDVGERGTRISGGERQRLGIARAMFTQPRLLVMDEATSSLDGETEASISKALLSLGDKTTVVLIAHRLSTIRNANMVVYISDGEIKAVGTFQEVRMAIPDFDKQANLLGL